MPSCPDNYVSFRPDPTAVGIDAFWRDEKLYAFPPFEHCWAGASEGAAGPRHRDYGGTRLAHSSLASSATPAAPGSSGLPDLRQTYKKSGLTGDSVELLMSS